MSHRHDAIILGAGVSGLTTGITLQLLGVNTKIMASARADIAADKASPFFASAFPSASIIPHSVYGKDLEAYFEWSQQVFSHLLQSDYSFIQQNRHFELFEFPVDLPDYASLVDKLEVIENASSHYHPVPKRTDESELFGWNFECYFVQYPQYAKWLCKLYESLGGSFERKRLSRPEISWLSTDHVVNCTGIWAHDLFEDTDTTQISIGYLVSIPGLKGPTTANGQTISYNYTPKPPTYTHEDGSPMDVYCYPRTDDLLLGGSRLQGTADSLLHIEEQETYPDTIAINEVEVPVPIIDLNREILQPLIDTELPLEKMNANVGFRHIRGNEESAGLRLESETDNDKLIVHNYGHGGAGVTLSWGAAIEVARFLSESIPSLTDQPGELIDRLTDQLSQS